MKIEILCEGKIKKNQANVLCNDYCLRISKLKHSGVSELKINELTDNKIKIIKKKKTSTLHTKSNRKISINGGFIKFNQRKYYEI